jgi:hypothetical protein
MHAIKYLIGTRPPTHSRAQVRFYWGEQHRAEQIARRLFGHRLSLREYAQLTGATDRATVEVGTLADSLYLEIHGPRELPYRGILVLRDTAAGPVIVNEGFHILRRSCQGGGVGLYVLSRQVDGARSLGIICIETIAGRRSYENGYYTWPRYGFDGRLAASTRQELPRRLGRADTVLDLMASAHGRRWWKEHGVPLRVAFDLSHRSRSSLVLRRYLSERWRSRANSVGNPPSFGCKQTPGTSPESGPDGCAAARDV